MNAGARGPDAAGMGFLAAPPRFMFFTGKGGVGKTSLSTAAAITLADAGQRVLLVSTDAATNLGEMLGVTLSNQPVAVPGVPGLYVLNIDPEAAAEAYRQRVLAQLAVSASEAERSTVREQLSGACTTEIAAFDQFAALLAGEGRADEPAWDHVVFDTAPTGHTLRLLSLPKSWSGILAGNDRGASCLGPHSGLKMQEARFNAALAALSHQTVAVSSRVPAKGRDETETTVFMLPEQSTDAKNYIMGQLFKAFPADRLVTLFGQFADTTEETNMPTGDEGALKERAMAEASARQNRAPAVR